MRLNEPTKVEVSTPGEARKANKTARDFAAEVGFSPAECDEIALAVSELASNLLKHAGGGLIQLKAVESEGRAGVQIVSEDHGPGIPDAELALTDGYSTAGSLGEGLGAVNRLMDAVDFSPPTEPGLRIVCERWLRPSQGISGRRLEFGLATRPFRRGTENGDAVVICQWEERSLAGVIDGLGHGALAQKAALAARHYVERHCAQPLDQLFVGTSRACRATRGVVMTLVRFDLARGNMTVAGIGNIETRLWGAQTPFSPVLRRGVVGQVGAPKPVATEHPWTNDNVVVLHSDGISSRWNWDELGDLRREAPSVLARRLLERHGRLEDDATVLVGRNAVS